MKNIKILSLLFLLIFGCNQPQNEPKIILNDENIIKDSFIKMIEGEFSKLKQQGHKSRDSCFEDKGGMFHIRYTEWINYVYDIKKTDSIVTPYYGNVIFKGIFYFKDGKTNDDCIKSPWNKSLNDQIRRKSYAYQDGNWILKEKYYY